MDLHTENVMLKFDTDYKFQISSPKFLNFTINGSEHAIPYFGIIPKIIDFGFAEIPEENIISDATDIQVLYYRSDNDLIFLFNHILSTLNMVGSSSRDAINDLFSKLDPTKSYVKYYTPHVRRIQDSIPTYEQMVTNSTWEEYKNTKVSKKQIHKKYTPLENADFSG